MQVVQVDVVGLQLLERGSERHRNVFGIRVGTFSAILELAQTELRGEEDITPLASALEPLADKQLAIRVRVGGVPEPATACVNLVEELGVVAYKPAGLQTMSWEMLTARRSSSSGTSP
jgi:hypothetical protein